jgi:hypothetical protein
MDNATLLALAGVNCQDLAGNAGHISRELINFRVGRSGLLGGNQCIGSLFQLLKQRL